MQAILINENGPHEGRRQWIRQGQQLTVGASAWADVVVVSEHLQPIHLLIDLNEYGCAAHGISDAAFEINGETKSQAILNDGDMIRVADSLFRIQLDGIAQPRNLQRIDLANSVVPANHRPHSVTPNRILTSEHDPQFWRIEPGDVEPPTGIELTSLIEVKIKVFGLCRFDRWRFPCPNEVRENSATIPETSSPQAIPYLPVLFPISCVEDPSELIAQGLDSGSLILVASNANFETILSFLRSSPGLFLSPSAMQNVLTASQPGAMQATLGPIDGIVLGTNRNWVFYCNREIGMV